MITASALLLSTPLQLGSNLHARQEIDPNEIAPQVSSLIMTYRSLRLDDTILYSANKHAPLQCILGMNAHRDAPPQEALAKEINMSMSILHLKNTDDTDLLRLLSL